MGYSAVLLESQPCTSGGGPIQSSLGKWRQADDGQANGSVRGAVLRFSLEGHVPTEHTLRSIDWFVDPSGIREYLKPSYNEMGRPLIAPEF
jgi:hypothetical protein